MVQLLIKYYITKLFLYKVFFTEQNLECLNIIGCCLQIMVAVRDNW